MYLHRSARLIYLATPRTGSTATAAALRRIGFVRPNPPADHHGGLDQPHSPVTPEDRGEWIVMTTVRNHWDAAVSWCAQKRVASETEPPWPREMFEEALDPNLNKWLKLKRMYWLHVPQANVVLRYETLALDLRAVLELSGLPMPFMGRENRSQARRWRHYSEFYTAETRDMISERYRDEILELGYTFEDRRQT